MLKGLAIAFVYFVHPSVFKNSAAMSDPKGCPLTLVSSLAARSREAIPAGTFDSIVAGVPAATPKWNKVLIPS
jgi:hypothetical protein